jgi:hypothetical protein
MRKIILNQLNPKSGYMPLFWIIVGLILPIISLRLLYYMGISQYYHLLIIFTICFLAFQYSLKIKRLEIASKNIVSGAFLFLLIYLSKKLFITFQQIPEWDYCCFYLFSKVGLLTNDFYNPDVFEKVFSTINYPISLSNDFMEEIVKVGFWYPPPSMILFLPLGLLEIKTSYLIWQSIITAFFLIDIYLLTRLFPSGKMKSGEGKFIFSLVPVILLFPYLTIPVLFSQTISLFLFFSILLVSNINSWKAGIHLVILIIIKPLAAIFCLYFLFFGKWKILFASTITGLIVLVISILFFGYEPILHYLISPPSIRMPEFIYLESESILGLLKNAQRDYPLYLSSVNVKLTYYLLSAILTLATLFFLNKLARYSSILSFLIFIPLAMLIYPVSGSNYDIMLLPVIVYIYCEKLFSKNFMNFLLIISLYYIGVYSFFIFNLLLWVLLISWPKLIELVKVDNISKFTYKINYFKTKLTSVRLRTLLNF